MASPTYQFLSVDGRRYAMYEVGEVLPCKAAILREHHTQVGTLLCSLARLTYFPCRLNVKLGGVNAVPEPRDVSFLTDSANPTIVMGRHRLLA